MAPAPDTSIQYLKGVGEKRAALYRKLGIETIRELLYHFPRSYIDLSAPYAISEAPLFEPCALRAVLVRKSAEQRIRKGLSIFKLLAADDTGELELTVFNSKYTVDKLELDTPYLFYGKVSGSLLRREMTSPDIYPDSSDTRIVPLYPQTAGLSSRIIHRNIRMAMAELGGLPDPIPPHIRGREGLPGMTAALRDIH